MLAEHERLTDLLQLLSLIVHKPKQLGVFVGGELHKMLMKVMYNKNPFLFGGVMHGLIGYLGHGIQDALHSV